MTDFDIEDYEKKAWEEFSTCNKLNAWMFENSIKEAWDMEDILRELEYNCEMAFHYYRTKFIDLEKLTKKISTIKEELKKLEKEMNDYLF